MHLIQRPHRSKIPDIKAVRALTRLLGKFRIKRCFRVYPSLVHIYDEFGQFQGTTEGYGVQIGWGLKESKDYVESKYMYLDP